MDNEPTSIKITLETVLQFHQDIAFHFCSSPLLDHRKAHSTRIIVAAPACPALVDYWGVGYISFLASCGLGGLVGLGLVAMCVLCLTV